MRSRGDLPVTFSSRTSNLRSYVFMILNSVEDQRRGPQAGKLTPCKNSGSEQTELGSWAGHSEALKRNPLCGL